jgi:hypothetical protein
MIDISVKLRAKNSSGDQELFITQDGESFWFTLCGCYKGEKIQIDFDEMTKSELEEIHIAIGLLLESVPD